MKLSALRVSVIAAAIAAASAAALVSTAAHAQTYNYQPTPTDLYDLDHHSLYTWLVNPSQINPSTMTVTGGSLTFTNVANWKNEANELHLWMFDTAANTGVKSFADDVSSNSNVTDLTDDFSNARYHNGTDANGAAAPWVIANGTAGTVLGSGAVSVTSGSNWNYDAANTGWQYGSSANGWADATVSKTVTFTFNASTLSTINTYIANGGNVAFGFDPDCHYNNNGITLSLTTAAKTGVNAVPEPGLLTFACTSGLPLAFGLLRARRRKMAA